MSVDVSAMPAAPTTSVLRRLELPLYALLIAALGGALLGLGAENTKLRERQPVSPKQLYAMLANPQMRLQIVYLRAYYDDNYQDTHIPAAIYFPGCDAKATPPAAMEHIYPYVTTVIVTEDGDPTAFQQCAKQFGMARNLSGGLNGWLDARLPEDTGEYSPPKASGGGGCL